MLKIILSTFYKCSEYLYSMSQVRPNLGRPCFLDHNVNICYDREINKIIINGNDVFLDAYENQVYELYWIGWF